MMLCIVGIQTVEAQCLQPYEFSSKPDFKVLRSSDVITDFYYPTTAYIWKQIVTPDGSLWIAGQFDKVIQYDGTNTGIVQTIVSKNMAKRDPNGVWTSITPISSSLFLGNVWLLNGDIYGGLPNGIKKYDEITNTWGPTLLQSYRPVSIQEIKGTNEFWVSNNGTSVPNSNMTGVLRWNIQTGAVTELGNSQLPDGSSGYFINENQTGDTVFVKFNDLFTNHRVLIKGRDSVLDFQDIGLTDPLFGSPNVFGGQVYGWSNMVRKIDGRIFASVVGVYGNFPLMEWNFQTQLWDSLFSKVVSGGGSSNEDYSWYDTVSKRLSTGMRYVYDIQNNEGYSFTNQSYFEPWYRIGGNLCYRGGILEDTVKPNAPNIPIPLGVTEINGAQNVSFQGTNAHRGDIAKMYEYGVVIDSIIIDDTNCSNFTFTQFADIGTHDYGFTLSDPFGNESTATSLTITVNYPTGLGSVDQEFAKVSTYGKTLTITSEIESLKIYNLSGQEIFSSQVNNNQFTQSFDYLPTGMYILKAIGPKGQMMTKKISF